MKKTLLALILAACMLLGLATVAGAATVSGTAIDLSYDDRKDVGELLGVTVETVEITDEVVTSTKVGSTEKDTNVLVYEDGTLYAVGTGTATLTVNGTAYSVTVSPAKLSLFLVTGHSIGAGEGGKGSQSIAIEPGQAYSSYRRDSLPDADGGLGWGADHRVGGSDNNEQNLDAFAAGNYGTKGVGSALAYQWTQTTGEKVWVMNLSVGGSALNEWLPGQYGHHDNANYTYKYEGAVKSYGYMQTVVSNEIAAGHYTLGHQLLFYFSGANFGATGYSGATHADMVRDYGIFWGGLKKDLAKDIDGDGQTETLESMGIVTAFWPNNNAFKYDKALNYYMFASDEYQDIYLASEICKSWITEEGLANFPVYDYATQSVAVAKPESILHTAQGGTSDNSVFCSADKVHLAQVAYNALGIDMIGNLMEYLDDQEDLVTEGSFLTTANTDLTHLSLGRGETAVVVPYTNALSGGVTFETSDNLEFSELGVTALDMNQGTITMKNAQGTVLDTLTVSVDYDYHIHCACGGHAEGMEGHTCESSDKWLPWGNTDDEKLSLPAASGYYYLVSDITPGSVTISAGSDVKLCLNGYSIDSGTDRTFYPAGNLSVTDCGEEENWGTITSAYTSHYGGILYQNGNDSGGIVNIYGGNWDAKGTSCWGGAILIDGTTNIYGGNFDGTTVIRMYVNASQGTRDGRGGTIYLMRGTLNIHGGTFANGKAQNRGGNICIAGGTFNMTGGTVTGGSVNSTYGELTDGASAFGGNLAILGGTSNITGGTFEKGDAQLHGGNVAVSSGTNVLGGTITGGTAGNRGGNIYIVGGTTELNATVSGGTGLWGANLSVGGGTLNMTGGSISGGTSPDGKVGSAHVAGGTFNLNGGILTGIGAVNGGSVYMEDGVFNLNGGTVTGGTASNQGGNLYVLAAAEVNIKSGTLSDGSVTGGNKYGGNLCLFGTATVSGGTISGGTSASLGGNICTLPGSTLTISGGTITGGKATSSGGNIFIGNSGSSAGTLTMTGGTVTAGSAAKGGNILADGNVTISGGTVSNGTATTEGGNIEINNRTNASTKISGTAVISGGSAPNGGSVTVQGTCTVSGGTITGGNATKTNGGNFYVGVAGTLTMTGGAISNGTVNTTSGYGGNIHVAYESTTKYGKAYLQGGTVSGGDAYCGGGLCVDGHATLSGTTFTANNANTGGNVYVSMKVANKVPFSNLTMTDGIIEKGTATYGGNVQVMGNMTMTGGVIRDGSSTSGGNVRIFRPGTFTLDGGTVENGSSTGSGGNFNLSGHNPTTSYANEATLIVKSGTITGGSAPKGNGGNINCGHYSVVEISGGIIEKGTAANGGNIRFYPISHTNSTTGVVTSRDAELTISGGIIRDGVATERGANIFMNTSTSTPSRVAFTMTGGLITGGTASDGTSVVIRSNGDLVLSGGVIESDEQALTMEKISATGPSPTLLLKDDARLDGTGVNLYVDKTDDEDGNAVSVRFENLKDEFIRVEASSEGAYATADADYSAHFINEEGVHNTTYTDGVLSLTEVPAQEAIVDVYNGGELFGKYTTVAAAAKIAVYGGDNYVVKLTRDMEETSTIDGSFWLDLNGYSLSGITVNGTVYGMDSATNTYTAANAGKLTLAGGEVAVSTKTTTEQIGAIRRYLAVKNEDGSYGFHRFYFGITHIAMRPEDGGIGYRATFAGSDAVKQYLDVEQGFGLIASTDGVPTDFASGQVAGFASETFASEGVAVPKHVLVKDILKAGMTSEELEARGETVIYAVSFLKTKAGDVVLSTSQAHSLKSVIETIDTRFETYGKTEQEALSGFYKTYEDVMDVWTLPNMHHVGSKFGDGVALTEKSLIALLDANKYSSTQYALPAGTYYLTEDADIGSRIIRVSAGTEVTLCLGGHTLSGSARMLQNYGTFNLYDCCTNGTEEQHGKMVSNATALAPVFYAYAGSVFNLYGGDLTATKTVSQAGIGAISHDGSDKTVPSAIMNMYGGRMYGGNVTANGGGLAIFNNATFNMYGGEIYDNHSEGEGGNVRFCTGTMNLYGGKIYDGSAVYGGNVYAAGTTGYLGEDLVLENGEAAHGGNLYLSGTAEAKTVEGTTFIGGQANLGGSIYVVGGMTTTFKNVTVKGGNAYYAGGNLYIHNTGTHLIENSVFADGTAGSGGNLYLYNDMSSVVDTMTVTLKDLTVTGGKAVGYDGTHYDELVGGSGNDVYVWDMDLTLTGKIIVDDFHVGPATVVKTEALDTASTIGVTMTDPGTFLADDTFASCFRSTDDTRQVAAEGGVLKITEKEAVTFTAPTEFSVGWSRVDITPRSPVYLDGMGYGDAARDGQTIQDPLYASIIAVADETGIENAVVFVTMDTLFVQKTLWETAATVIGEQTGIPAKNILLTASHTHYATDFDHSHPDNRNNLEFVYNQLAKGVAEALQDLTPATAEAGTTELANMNYVRRFIFERSDGTVENSSAIRGDNSGTFLDYEDEKDATLQAIRFVREDMDIVLVNWQAHPHGASAKNKVSAGTVEALRNSIEGTNGVTSVFQKKTMCAFFQGAAGNLATTSSYETTEATSNRADYGQVLAEGVVTALANGAPVETGTPKVMHTCLDAKELGWYKTTVASGRQVDVDLFCVSIGRMAFATAPYEMFCNNGMQLKNYVAENDLFDILFICENTNGENKYVATYRAFALDADDDDGEDFEVDTCRYVQGTAEKFINEHAKMLIELSGRTDVEAPDFLQDAIDAWEVNEYNPENMTGEE